MSKYQIDIRDEGGDWGRDLSCEADDAEEALDWAEQYARDHIGEGDYGQDEEGGARVSVWLTATDKDDEEYDRHVDIDIEVDESDVDPHADEHAHSGHEHEWRSPHDIVGGCDSNPGVWSTGGTSLSFLAVCCCGARKHEESTGPQYNPGDHDTIRIEYPDGLWPWGEDCTTPGETADA